MELSNIIKPQGGSEQREVLGPSKPLTGWAMEDLAGAYKRPPLSFPPRVPFF